MKSISGEEYLERMMRREYASIVDACWDNKNFPLIVNDPRDVRQLCDALVRAGRLADAIDLIEKVVDATPPDVRGGDDYCDLSAAYWLKARREEGGVESTIANLRRALRCNYGDGAKNMTPALLLYYVAVRTQDSVLKQEATDHIKAKLATGWAKNWPAPLGRFLIGVADDEHVREELSKMHPSRQPDECCRYDFYKGIKFLEARNEKAAHGCFRSAVDRTDQKTWTTEFVFARDELGETPSV